MPNASKDVLRALLICLVVIGLLHGQARSANAVLGPEAAKSIPIADGHFHIMYWMKVEDLVGYMDRNGIRWAVGHGVQGIDGGPRIGPARNAEAAALLGKRYARFTGMGAWFTLRREQGVSSLEDAESVHFAKALAEIEADLREGNARGIGELHANSFTTARNPVGKFKIKADAPTLKALLDLAAKYKRPMSLHAEWDAETAREFERLAEWNRGARLILAHCGNWARPSEIRILLERQSNVVCDLAYRGAPPLRGQATSRRAFNAERLLDEWKNLIEDYSDRFVVGIDDAYSWAEYEEIVRAIRFGLLANLSPATAEKVAFKNAQAWFGLE